MAVDLASEINPIKKVVNIGKSVASFTTNYDTGIWVGKRPLASGNAMVSLSVSPNYSVEHWAIMINGTVYEVLGKNAGGGMQV